MFSRSFSSLETGARYRNTMGRNTMDRNLNMWKEPSSEWKDEIELALKFDHLSQ